MNEDRRREDAALRLETKFYDFLKVYDQDKEIGRVWRKSMEEKIKPLEKIRTPISIIIFLVGAIASGVCLEIGKWFWAMFSVRRTLS